MLKEYMEKTGLNSKSVAERLNVTPAYISMVLKGKKTLSKKCVDIITKSNLISETSTYTVYKNSVLDRIINLLIVHEESLDDSMINELEVWLTE